MLGRLLSAACRQLYSRFSQARREKPRRNFRPHFDALESRRLLAAADFQMYRQGPVPGSPVGSFVNPQIASLGETFFATGNNYASVSDDNGLNWNSVNPASVFPQKGPQFGNPNTWDDAGLSGTTRLATDTTRGMVMWLAEYNARFPVDQDGNPILDEAENGLRLAVSYSDEGLQNSEWIVHDFSIHQLGEITGHLLVNPQMQVSDNFVYIEADVVRLEEEDGVILEDYRRSLWWRVSLDDLQAGGNAQYALYNTDPQSTSLTQGPIGLINGAGDTMYGAMNIPGSRMRIFSWKDSDLNPTFVEKSLVNNPTASDSGVTSYRGLREDANGDDVTITFPNKVQTGWLTPSGELGFMWNSAPRPANPFLGVQARTNAFIRTLIVDSTTFDSHPTSPKHTYAILSQPDLYSNSNTYFYPAAAVNAEGGVAAIVGRYTGTSPSAGPVANYILMLDSFTPAGLPSGGDWEDYQADVGTQPVGTTPTDFVTAGRFYGIMADDNYTDTWIAAGYVDNGASSPRFYWFGREEDHPPPNLKGAALDVTQDAAHDGDTITARYRITNEGITDAGPFTVGFFASIDEVIDEDDFLLGTDTLPALAAGLTTSLRTATLTPDSGDPFWTQVNGGSYYVGMITDWVQDDPDGAIVEAIETDNSNLGLGIDVTQMFPASFGDNDTRDTASDLGFLSGLRTYDRLAIGPTGDEDWFKVVAPFSGTLTAKIDFQNVPGGNLDVFIRTPTTVILGQGTPTSTGKAVTISVTAGTTYYIQVEGVAGAQNSYVFTTDYRIAPVDAYEPNNNLQNATDFGTLPIVSEPDLNIHQFDNEDFYKFTAPGTGQFTARIDFLNQYGDLDLYFYAALGGETSSTGNGNSETITAQVEAGQLYYLRVTGRGADTNKYSLEYDAPAPPVFVSGNTVFVTGQSPDDTFTFIPESPSFGNNRVIVNSVSFTVPASSTKYRFDGRGGNNTVIVNGTSRTDAISNTFKTVKMNNFTMDLFAIQNLTLQGQAGNDKITATGSRIVTINGGDDNDAIFGGTSGDTLVGGRGQDRLFGGAGDDSLFGNEASDLLNGGEGTDRLFGGGGNDTYQFGQPSAVQIDYVEELDKGGTDTFDFANGSSSVTVDLTKDNALAQQGLRSVRSLAAGVAIQLENIIGSPGDDVLLGNAANNDITGGDGSDNMEGRQGDDRYMFADTQTGQTDRIREFSGNGRDTLYFAASTIPVIVDLLKDTGMAIQGSRVVNMFAAGQQVAMEDIVGGFANDTLLGNAAKNIIEGGEGSDTMQGRTGDDRYLFRDAQQVQTDTLTEFAGGGRDTLDFSGLVNALTDVNVDLRTAGQTIATHASRTVNVATAGQSDHFEIIIGSLGNDILIGNSFDNSIYGGSGRDIVVGSRGKDFLNAGAGDDIVIGGPTNHSLANLQQIRLEWVNNLSYNARVDHIRGPNSGLNGQNFLTIDTVFEDNSPDNVRGDLGTDWFWLADGDVDDLGGGELFN